MTSNHDGLIERLRTDIAYLRERLAGTLHTIANDISEAADALASLTENGEGEAPLAHMDSADDEAIYWAMNNLHALRRDNGEMLYGLTGVVRAFQAGKAASPAIATTPVADVPSGWWLVPIEPTEAMYAAAEREWDGRMSVRTRGVWQAMLAASPSSPQVMDTGGPSDEKWITVQLQWRDDGGLRVQSPDYPGLILSGSDPFKVAGDIPAAIKGLDGEDVQRHYVPQVIEFHEGGYAQLVLEDTAMIAAEEMTVTALRRMTPRGELLGFQWDIPFAAPIQGEKP